MLPFALIAVFLCVTNGYELPKGWSVCKLSDPKQSKCLKSAIQTALNDLITGHPILDNLPLDPLPLKEVKLFQRMNTIHLNLTITDAELMGIKDMKILRVDGRFPEIVVHATAPHMELKGDYEMAGKVLGLPADGRGLAEFGLSSVKGSASIKFTDRTIKGKKYYEIEDLTTQWEGENPTASFEATTKGGVGDLLTKDPKSIGEQFKPTFQRAVANIFKSVASRVLSKLTKNELTPR